MNLKYLLSAAFTWLKELFTKDKTQSEILKILIENTSDANIQAIKDKQLGETALEIVRNLNKSDSLSSKDKAELFNQIMGEFVTQAGKTIAKSALNLLRELAVTAVKVAATAAVTTLLSSTQQVEQKK